MDANWKNLCDLATDEIEATLAELPAPLRERAVILPVTFEQSPNAGLQKDGIASDTLGLFTGAEMADAENELIPAQITLFLLNIWGFSENTPEIFREEVRTTFLHELGHFLGLDEEDLADRGLE
jgi:predicted Zn-dependent protease with MMP-like domain